MNYDIFINDDKVANELSYGELNQWILDLDSELSGIEKDNFRKDIGANSSDDFENFIYSNIPSAPLKIRHGKDLVIIKENDF